MSEWRVGAAAMCELPVGLPASLPSSQDWPWLYGKGRQQLTAPRAYASVCDGAASGVDQSQQQTPYPVSEKLHVCSQTDSLQAIFERFAEIKFQTLVCVDAAQRCTGIVAIGDLVAYFID